MIQRFQFIVLTLTLFAVTVFAPARTLASAAKMPKSIRLSAGAMGQSPYMLFGLISRWIQKSVPGLRAQVIAGGGKANVRLVDKGQADVAFAIMSNYSDALYGKGDYKKAHSDFRVLANIQGYSAFYFMVREDTGLKSIRGDFINKKYPLKMATFLKAGSPEINTRRVLKEYGITYADIEKWGGSVTFCQWGDCVNLIRDGHVNALVGNTSLPSHFHAEAAKARRMWMLEIGDDVRKSLMKKYGFIQVTIPKGTYGIVKEDMYTVGTGYVYYAHKRLHDRIAYEVVKSMAEHAAEVRAVHASLKTFDPAKMVNNLEGKIHPGALKYYKERGWIK